MKDLDPYKMHGPNDISLNVLKECAEMPNKPFEELDGRKVGAESH